MCQVSGHWTRSLLRLLPVVTFIPLFLAAICPAQPNCPPSTITSITPTTWTVGERTKITVIGTGFTDVNPPDEPWCSPTTITVNIDAGSITLSDVTFVNATELTAIVKPAAIDPTEMACVWAGSSSFYGPIHPAISAQPSDTTSCMGTAQIVNTGPTIVSITPSAWFAGRSYDITITGTKFLTASDPGGPTELKITEGTGNIRLSNVVVSSATQITASVNPTKDSSAGLATAIVTNSSSGANPGKGAGYEPILPIPIIYDWNGNSISGENATPQSAHISEYPPRQHRRLPKYMEGGRNEYWGLLAIGSQSSPPD